MNGLATKPALEDEEAFLFSGSSVAAFKFPRELASREFMEKLNGKHRWGGGRTQTTMYAHAEFVFLKYTVRTRGEWDADSSDQGKWGQNGFFIVLVILQHMAVSYTR